MSIYNATVPVIQRSLKALDACLDKGQAHADALKFDSAVLFGSMTFWLVLVASGVGGDYSRALLALDGLLCTVALGGMRMLRRSHHELRSQVQIPRRPSLLVDVRVDAADVVR